MYYVKNPKLWPLIVYKSKQGKPDKRYIPNTRQSRSVYRRERISDLSLAQLNTVIKQPNIDNATNDSY